MVEAAEEASRLLAQQDVSATVWDVRVVKPLDHEMIADACGHSLVVTVEDGVRNGGAGSSIVNAIADAIADASTARDERPRTVVLGLPDRYIAQGNPSRILAEVGLDGPGIAASVLAALGAAEVVGG
jgi:1-deoxy-D-xylulose-5-phosphate synthase